MCIFLTNVLQNLRKRIGAKLLDGGTRHGHTLSQPAHNVEQPSARQRNAIQMFQMWHSKKGRKEYGERGSVVGGGGGGGVGDRLESHVETHSFFFACVVVFVRFEGGSKLLI